MPPRPRFDRRAPVRELPNINERIKYPQLRVVDSDGKQLGVLDRLKALELASQSCLLYTSPSPRDREKSRMPSSA